MLGRFMNWKHAPMVTAIAFYGSAPVIGFAIANRTFKKIDTTGNCPFCGQKPLPK